MARVFIGIGTNVGDRHGHIEHARRSLAALSGTRLVAFSPVYETEPVGPLPQGRYLNAAAEIETTLAPAELLELLHGIERDSGRLSAADRIKWGPRTLDLDILLYDDRVIQQPGLTVPHPLMHERRFVLEPLADIAPEVVHPVLKKAAVALLRELAGLPGA